MEEIDIDVEYEVGDVIHFEACKERSTNEKLITQYIWDIGGEKFYTEDVSYIVDTAKTKLNTTYNLRVKCDDGEEDVADSFDNSHFSIKEYIATLYIWTDRNDANDLIVWFGNAGYRPYRNPTNDNCKEVYNFYTYTPGKREYRIKNDLTGELIKTDSIQFSLENCSILYIE